jgi:uncharacterized damage-inducible protein DinB
VSEATSIDARIQRLQASVEGLLQRMQTLPSDVLYRAPQAGEWPVMSTLAHLEELLPYWAHEAASIARQPGQPFGRTHDDAARLGAIDQHGRDALEAIVPRIRSSLAECITTLRGIPPAAWEHAGQHPRRGSMTVSQVVDDFLVSHADEHAAQIQATLDTLGAART